MDKETRTWAMLLHLSVFAGYVVPFAGLITPIVIWQIKKDEMPEIDAHGRKVANFLISMFIYGVICWALCFVLIGFALLFVLTGIGIAYPIIGAIKANDGDLWSYPGMFEIV
ncbi:MAG: DUF4870 domain-containing protein [Planctomycetota bacterium]